MVAVGNSTAVAVGASNSTTNAGGKKGKVSHAISKRRLHSVTNQCRVLDMPARMATLVCSFIHVSFILLTFIQGAAKGAANDQAGTAASSAGNDLAGIIEVLTGVNLGSLGLRDISTLETRKGKNKHGGKGAAAAAAGAGAGAGAKAGGAHNGAGAGAGAAGAATAVGASNGTAVSGAATAAAANSAGNVCTPMPIG